MPKIQSLPVHHGRRICAVEVEGDSSFVEITNASTDGRVVIDGVRWVWLGE